MSSSEQSGVVGKESYQKFFSNFANKDMVEYFYQLEDGAQFSCLADSLERARALKDSWLHSIRQ